MTIVCLAHLWLNFLEDKGMNVKHRSDGESGMLAFKEESFDVIILDVKMPFKDGFKSAEEIRRMDEEIPIIFVTGESEQNQRIRGLETGADDYLTKPYSMQELYLRIQNLLKRSGKMANRASQETYELGNYQFNVASRELSFENESRELTTTESKLLLELLKSPDGVIHQEKVLKSVWDDTHAIRGRSLTVYISKLRTYLGKDSNVQIKNVHGRGYQLVIKRG